MFGNRNTAPNSGMGGLPITGLRLAAFDFTWKYLPLTILAICFIGIGRFFSGHNMFGGGRSTDATFLHPARSIRKSWWANQRGIARLAVRLGTFWLLVLYTNSPALVWLLLAVGAVFALRSLVRRWRQRQHEKAMVAPIWPVVAGIIGVDTAEPAARWVDIPAPAPRNNGTTAQRQLDEPPHTIEPAPDNTDNGHNNSPRVLAARLWAWASHNVWANLWGRLWARLTSNRQNDQATLGLTDPATNLSPLVPDPDEPILIGLRAADPDDDRRVQTLVRLFDQRYRRDHYGWVDHSNRLAVIKTRPPEPTYWPYVAAILNVSPDELAEDHMRVELPPPDSAATGPRVSITVPHGTFLETTKTDLKTLLKDEYGCEWSADTGHRNRRDLVLYPTPPERTPPQGVGLVGEHEDYQERS